MKLLDLLCPSVTTAACALLFAIPVPGLTQAPVAPANGSPQRPITAVNAAAQPVLGTTDGRVNLEFNDQPLELVARELMESFPEENIIVPPSIANVRVTMRLRMATLVQALRAITLATEGRINVTSEEPGLNSFSAAPELIPAAPSCRIYSLANYLSGKAEPQFNQAIDELMVVLKKAAQHLNAASAGAKVNEPRLEFHQPTKLLIAVGSEPELAILTQIVQALGGTAPDVAMMGGFPGLGAPANPGYGVPAGTPVFPGGFSPQSGVPGLEGVAPGARRR